MAKRDGHFVILKRIIVTVQRTFKLVNVERVDFNAVLKTFLKKCFDEKRLGNRFLVGRLKKSIPVIFRLLILHTV